MDKTTKEDALVALAKIQSMVENLQNVMGAVNAGVILGKLDFIERCING